MPQSGAMMYTAKLLLRWIAAIVAAAIVYIVVFVVGALIWQRFGTNALGTAQWSTTIAIALAMMVGAFIVPREQWRAAALAILCIALLFPFWGLLKGALSGALHWISLIELLAMLTGGGIAYYALRTAFAGQKINRVAGRSRNRS
jgi:hypothetical protein